MSGAAASAIAVVDRSLAGPLAIVRRGYETAMLAAMRGGEAAVRSDIYLTQLKYVRQGRWAKLRLAKLVGKRDVSNKSALHFLDSVAAAGGQQTVDYKATIKLGLGFGVGVGVGLG